jgi:hypothetical protein
VNSCPYHFVARREFPLGREAASFPNSRDEDKFGGLFLKG